MRPRTAEPRRPEAKKERKSAWGVRIPVASPASPLAKAKTMVDCWNRPFSRTTRYTSRKLTFVFRRSTNKRRPNTTPPRLTRRRPGPSRGWRRPACACARRSTGLRRAVSLQAERALEQADQSAEYSALQDDRSRLALELDAVPAAPARAGGRQWRSGCAGSSGPPPPCAPCLPPMRLGGELNGAGRGQYRRTHLSHELRRGRGGRMSKGSRRWSTPRSRSCAKPSAKSATSASPSWPR